MINKAPMIAAIDVGTNSFHLVVTTVNSHGMLQIHLREKEVVRLGSSSGDMKYITPESMERGLKALSHFADLAHAKNAVIKAVATSAVREALNKEEFLDKVKSATGIEIEVISGVEEGRLIYIGVLHALPILNQKTLILDIGGGSTETIVGYEGEMRYVNSAKLGSIRLTKRFSLDGDVTKAQIDECRNYIRGEWAPNLKRIFAMGFDTVVGTSGTIQNIASMSLAINKESVPDVLNGLTVSKTQLLRTISKITNSLKFSERAQIPGIDPKRVDIIIGGALILEQALHLLNIPRILISTYALREGIVFDSVQKDEAINKFHHLSRLRYQTIYNLCNEYKVNLTHAEHVKNICLKLFDSLQSIHNLGYAEREILEAAALLHDIGYYISHDQHHKHSFYIISHCIMPGFTSTESDIIANIARYHRKSHPKKKHENFQLLTKDKQELVKILSSILRIAEGIDRRQQQFVKDIQVDYSDNTINIYLEPVNGENSIEIEIWGANRRKLLMEETFWRSVNIDIVK